MVQVIDMNILCKPFEALSSAHVYQMLRLRSEVFVVEQTCIYQDIDNKDIQHGVHHLLIESSSSELMAYARLLPKGLSYDDVSMGRVLVAQAHRGKSLGKKVIAHSLKHIALLWPGQSITIGAQSHLVDLYRSFGFVEQGQPYLEDGIAHIDMQAVSPNFKEYL
ncbi:GNAT family N-acetyltransferase [Glaciecola siphonariae]|uniref:GNAT family N-acetyltransferase n=1 Tax=Glaciecola siphonariae TaxID=521012 RepID=A0ABV9LX25_9ALTE